jgi:tetratricopeptide (TPR) repeat protein
MSQTPNKKNIIENSHIEVTGNLHVGDVTYKIVKGGIAIALVLLLGLGFWQKEMIKDWLGLNRFFSANDQNFKILVLPFKQICQQNDKNYDAGFVVSERLNEISQKEKLKIAVHYWGDYNFVGFDDQNAKALREYHHADMIIFGAYETDACSGDGNKVCINYITDDKWKIGDAGNNMDRSYQKGGIPELRTGKLQEKVENLATFISVIAQVKNIDHEKYLTLLTQLLDVQELGTNSKAFIYSLIADKLTVEGKLEEPLHQYERALKMFIANNDKQNIAFCFQRIGSMYKALGNLDTALRFYTDYNLLEKELYTAYPNNMDFKKCIAISHQFLGNTHTSLGNLDKALNFYADYNKLMKELCVAFPKNIDFKIGLAWSYEKLGRTYSSLGHLDKALSFYENGVKLFTELYAAYPNNVEFKKGLAGSYQNLGITHTSLSNLERALSYYEDFNKLFNELYTAYPNNVEFKNGLAISYQFLGDTYKSLKHLEKALNSFEVCNKLNKELYTSYPNNVEFKNGLAISYQFLGDTHKSLGHLEKTLSFYEEFNKLMKDLYVTYPNNVNFKKGLAISYEKLGVTNTSLEHFDKALNFFKENSKLEKELYTAYPNNVEYKNNFALSYQWLGWFFEKSQNNKTKAKEYYKNSEKLLIELTTSFPNYVAFQKNLKLVQSMIAEKD